MKKSLPILILLLLIAGLFCGAAIALSSPADDAVVSHQYRLGETFVVNTKDCAYLTKITFSKEMSPFFKQGADLKITEADLSFLDKYNLALPKLTTEDNRLVRVSDDVVRFGIAFVVTGNNGYAITVGKPGTFTFELPVNKTEEPVVGWFWNGKWRNCPVHPLGNDRWQVEYTNLDGYYVVLAIEEGTQNPFTGVATPVAAVSLKNTSVMENTSAENLSGVNETVFAPQENDAGIPVLLIVGIAAAVVVVVAVSIVIIRQKKTQKKNKEPKEES
ncbi:MAG TPA: hypothetical protein O0X27_03785 [Methanocorpusculum sp.]|nr:hypothetical protein [Methanocorpusculum sp.]